MILPPRLDPDLVDLLLIVAALCAAALALVGRYLSLISLP
jgi:hypothetical protein